MADQSKLVFIPYDTLLQFAELSELLLRIEDRPCSPHCILMSLCSQLDGHSAT